MGGRKTQRGQAGVETAIVLPLLVFTLLGMLQLTVALHARISTEYAAFRAARAASVYRLDCEKMVNAALLGILPTLPAPKGARTGSDVGSRYRDLAAATLGSNRDASDDKGVATPLVVVDYAVPRPRDRFDDALEVTEPAMKVNVKVTYFYRYRFPFVDGILSRFWLALQTGAAWAGTSDPTLPVAKARSPGTPEGTYRGADLATVQSAVARGYFVTPVVATWTMRMMSDLPSPRRTAGRCQ